MKRKIQQLVQELGMESELTKLIDDEVELERRFQDVVLNCLKQYDNPLVVRKHLRKGDVRIKWNETRLKYYYYILSGILRSSLRLKM